MAVLECHGLDAGYRGVAVVRDIELSVDAGEVVALLGPNGAGKTTVLRTIAGLLESLAGDIRFDGRTVDSARPERLARAGLCLIPDDRGLFRHLTARENLRLGAVGRSADVQRVISWFPELEALLDRRVGLLSGGEQQMLAIGLAVSTRPKVLMIDELSLGLAPIVVARLMPQLRRLAEEFSTAVLLVEQHVEEALALADRAYVMAHGRMVDHGIADELASDRQRMTQAYLGRSVEAAQGGQP